jgi:heptaprenyl diphosphate synthase
MDVVSSEDELGKEPGVDLKEGVYTLPVLHALHGERGAELRSLLSEGVPEGERLERALQIVRAPETVARARAAVASEVSRARDLAERLPDLAARRALVTLAEFLAARCGAAPGLVGLHATDGTGPKVPG